MHETGLDVILDAAVDVPDDALVRHANVEEAFGYTRKGELPRQRRELLELIYETRSLPTHTGSSPSGPLMGMLGSTESMGSPCFLTSLEPRF